MIMLFCIVASGTVTNFFPAVVSTLGYDDVVTLLLTSPPYVLAVLATYINALHADKTGERYLHVVIPLCVAVAAFILAVTTDSLAPRYVAMMLMVCEMVALLLTAPSSQQEADQKQVPSVYSGYVVALAWISNTMPRPPAKRAAGLAFINAVSNTSSIYASYMYPDSSAPAYTIAFVVNSITAVVAICAATVLRTMLARLNRKLEAGVYVPGAINGARGEAAIDGFRFKL